MPQLVSTPRADFIFTPCASLRPNYFCIYSKVEKYIKTRNGDYIFYRPTCSNRTSFSVDSSINRYSSERLTKSAAAKLRNAISLLVAVANTKKLFDPELQRHVKFKVNFITLTLSAKQKHSDSEIVKLLLEPFLRAFRDRCPGLLYVWKSEVQDCGNIHFHISSNRYISCFFLRRLWNKIQASAGYLHVLNIEKTNSTDVHAVRQDATLASYLTSYVTKKDYYKKVLKRYFKRYAHLLKSQDYDSFSLPKNYFKFIKRGVTCRLWDCSKALKTSKCIIEDLTPSVSEELSFLLKNSKKISISEYVKSAAVNTSDYYKVPTVRRVWFEFLDKLKKLDQKSTGIY